MITTTRDKPEIKNTIINNSNKSQPNIYDNVSKSTIASSISSSLNNSQSPLVQQLNNRYKCTDNA